MPRPSRRNPSSQQSTITAVRKLPALPRRDRDAHKGSFGRVLVIGGSRGMIGAPALAANAALRSGAGLVTVACPASIQMSVATLCPCATSIPLPERQGIIDLTAAHKQLAGQWQIGDGGPDVVAIGPGLGRGGAAFNRALLKLLLAIGRDAETPIVIDADALNALAELPQKERSRLRSAVITPHPGELGRWLGCSAGDVQQDRSGAVTEAARQFSSDDDNGDSNVVVLKGRATMVTDGRRRFTNQTGNPGLASGGTGDVLAGVIAALIGQGLSRFDAAVLGVHVHGAAGDAAAHKLGQVSMTALDVIEALPDAFAGLAVQ